MGETLSPHAPCDTGVPEMNMTDERIKEMAKTAYYTARHSAVPWNHIERAIRTALEEYGKERDADLQCSTCVGTKHASGLPCICGGTNRRDDEVDGLRRAATHAIKCVEETAKKYGDEQLALIVRAEKAEREIRRKDEAMRFALGEVKHYEGQFALVTARRTLEDALATDPPSTNLGPHVGPHVYCVNCAACDKCIRCGHCECMSTPKLSDEKIQRGHEIVARLATRTVIGPLCSWCGQSKQNHEDGIGAARDHEFCEPML